MKKIKHFVAKLMLVVIIITSVNMWNATDVSASKLSDSSDEAISSQEAVNTIAEAVEHMAGPEEFLTWSASEILKEIFKNDPMPGSKSEIEEIEEILNKVNIINSKLDQLSEKINQQETVRIVNDFKMFDKENGANLMVKALNDIDKDTTLTSDQKGDERKKLLLYNITNTPTGSTIQDQLYSTAFDGVYDKYKAFLSTKFINADNNSMYIISMYDRMLRTTDKWYHKYYKDKIAFQNYLVGKYMTVAMMEKLSITARIQEYETNSTDAKAIVLREKLAEIDNDVSEIQNIFKDNLAFEPDVYLRYYMYPGHEMTMYMPAKELFIPIEPNQDKGLNSEREWINRGASGDAPLAGIKVHYLRDNSRAYEFQPKLEFWRSFISFTPSNLCPSVEWYESVYRDYGSSKPLYDIFFDVNEGNLSKPYEADASWLFVADPAKGHEMKYHENNFTADYILTPVVNSSGEEEYKVIYKYHTFSNEPVLDHRYLGICVVDGGKVNENEKFNESLKIYNAPSNDRIEENSSFTHPDRDKLKSVFPQKTVMITSGSMAEDMKVLAVNDTTRVNQELLVNNFAQQVGKKSRILNTFSLHTNRMLGSENGKVKNLRWANLEKKSQVVYALCYNQTDKAYFIQGIIDENGVATFNNFLLRDATTITIFVLE